MWGAIFGAAANGLQSIANNSMAEEREETARRENYKYGEMAAQNADIRTRELYEDLQSPAAMMKQLKEAGLSPSLMYGGEMGGSVSQGAQGSGPAGIAPNVFGIDAMQAAQIGLMQAQTRKTEAETANVSKDTEVKELERYVKELENTEYKNTWTILNSTWKIEGTDEDTSIFELARDSYTYEQFMDKLRGSETDASVKQALTTEKGQDAARSIFLGANKFHRDIMVLSSESVNARFELDIAEKLANSDFAKLNAEAACAELRKSISTNELDSRQKEAWNNLLNRLEKSNPTIHDILIVLGMIVNNALTNYRVTPNVGKKI